MKYPCEIRELKIGTASFRLMEIQSSDAVFSDLVALGKEHEHVKDERIPYWAELWPSAIGLAQHILHCSYFTPATKVLEIGCGLGLPGIAAGRMGAQVTFTDYVDDALELARANWQQNNSSSAKFELLDWRNPDTARIPDVLLASDVAYETRAFEPLLHLFDTMLKPGGRLLLSEPGRKYTSAFFQLLNARGYERKKYEYPVSLRGVRTVIGVYEIINRVAKPLVSSQLLETSRLRLRELTETDAASVFELNNDTEVIRQTGETAPESLEAALEQVRSISSLAKNRCGLWAVELKANQLFIGWCGIKWTEHNEAELGFRILKKFRGCGYATEAARACLQFGFCRLELTKIAARVLKSNEASIHLLEKAGMKNPVEIKAHDAPALCYTMKCEEWNCDQHAVYYF